MEGLELIQRGELGQVRDLVAPKRENREHGKDQEALKISD
jgi:hypothetical protein